MATDAPPTSYAEPPGLTEWDSLSEEDQIKQREEITKCLEDPETIKKFSEACKNIGKAAAAIEHDFKAVIKGFIEFIKKHDKAFPHVQAVYLPAWEEIMGRWGGESGIIWSSMKLAHETTTALTDFGTILELVAKIKTQDDLQHAKQKMRDFLKDHPEQTATQVVSAFEYLKSEIQQFSNRFTEYIEYQRQTLSYDAQKYEADIKRCQKRIDNLNQQITVTSAAFGVCSVFGILAIPSGAFLIYLKGQRKEAQTDLEKAKGNLARTIDKQKALAALQANFEKLKPDIETLFYQLCIFANVWVYIADQALEVYRALMGKKSLTSKKFQSEIKLYVAQVKPLRQGLGQYATHISSLKASSNT